jgi:hypothetical protein
VLISGVLRRCSGEVRASMVEERMVELLHGFGRERERESGV